MENLLKQILAAQLAQIALLQSIATSLGAQVMQGQAPETIGQVDLKEALKGLEAASFQLATR